MFQFNFKAGISWRKLTENGQATQGKTAHRMRKINLALRHVSEVVWVRQFATMIVLYGRDEYVHIQTYQKPPHAMKTFLTVIVTVNFLSLFAGSAVFAAPKPEKTLQETPGLLKAALQGPLQDVEDVVFAVRGIATPLHYYENFGRKYGDSYVLAKGEVSRLAKLNLRTGKATTILEDADGAVRDPILHYDAQKILFSYRPGGTNHYHLYEIGIDGANLTQLTSGEFDDIEPTYLPSGEIMFISSRGNRRVPCWKSQVGLLYKFRADGSQILPMSAGIEHENTPWMLPDGRVAYTRWEYVDRDEVGYHHLWVVNPDGTRHMTLFGNMHKYGSALFMLDAKPIPGTDKLVSIFGFHNTVEHGGDVTVVDISNGPDDEDAYETICDIYPLPAKEREHRNMHGWRDPYPLSEDCFLVAAQKSLYIMDSQGRAESIYTLQEGDKTLWVHEPRPIMPREREPVIAPSTDLSRTTGELILADITEGRNMPGVEKGEITELLVMEELPKPTSFDVGPNSVSLDSTFILHRVLGTVPVEEDGSAYMELPANRPFFFVARNGKGESVKRMLSFVNVMPGEVTSCVGCHEQRTVAPGGYYDSDRPLQALTRGPSRIRPVEGVPDVIDYKKHIQPIWDAKCVSCHNYEKYAGNLSLTGDLAPEFTHSYLNLLWAGVISYNGQGSGNAAPYTIGASASKLVQLLKEGDHATLLNQQELRTVEMWIESSVAFAGSYGAQGTGQIRYKMDDAIHKNRCVECHQPGELENRWTTGRNRLMGRWFNLSEPENSLALLAPLAKQAGGLGICKQREAKQTQRGEPGEPAVVFQNTSDPDYQKLLTDLREAAAKAADTVYHDEPGFVPKWEYTDEMIRFGILPPGTDLKKPVDIFQADRAYWQSLWWQPVPPAQVSNP